MPSEVEVVDSHTGGEPTRVVIAGGPVPAGRTLAEKRASFAADFDRFRSAVVNEPRGSRELVGALLCEPSDAAATAGVIFFNNVGYLNMCGHGLIGLVVTLAHLGRIEAGAHLFETPVGTVTAWLHDDGQVSFRNVHSFRHATDVEVKPAGYGPVCGDVAWGGNWFYLVRDHEQTIAPERIEQLIDYTWAIRQELEKRKLTGKDGAEIDHIELFGPPRVDGAHSKNFVLCPGKAYDRSPCGTGTSARLACLFEDGRIAAGETWRQESIIGSVFEGSVELIDGRVHPRIKGAAHITARARLLFDPRDPFRHGIPD